MEKLVEIFAPQGSGKDLKNFLLKTTQHKWLVGTVLKVELSDLKIYITAHIELAINMLHCNEPGRVKFLEWCEKYPQATESFRKDMEEEIEKSGLVSEVYVTQEYDYKLSY